MDLPTTTTASWKAPDYKPLTMAPEVSWALSSKAYLKASLERSRLKSEKGTIEGENTETRKACDIGCYAGECGRVNSLYKDNKMLGEQIAILQTDKSLLQIKTAEYVNEIARLKRHIQSMVYKKDCHDRVEYLEQLRAENAITIYELEQYKLNSKAEIACLIQKQLYTKNDDMPLVVAEEIRDTSDLKAQVESLKLQLATEKRISQKYARDLQQRDKQQATLTAM